METSSRIENADEHYTPDLIQKFEEHIKATEQDAEAAKENARKMAEGAIQAKEAEDRARTAWRQAQEKLDKAEKGKKEADEELDRLTKRLHEVSRSKEDLEEKQRKAEEKLRKATDEEDKEKLNKEIDELKRVLERTVNELGQIEEKQIAARQEAKEKTEQVTKDGEESKQRKAEKDEATTKAQKARRESEKAEIESFREINRLETARTEQKRLELEKKQADLDARVVQADLKFNAWTNKALVWSIVATVVLFTVLFAVIAFHRELLNQLENITTARGLITFTVAMGTIIIALMLVLVTLLGNWPDSQERFNRGKEILAILVGVLGTIVGFYYGATKSPVATAEKPPAAEAGANVIGSRVPTPPQRRHRVAQTIWKANRRVG